MVTQGESGYPDGKAATRGERLKGKSGYLVATYVQ